MPFIEDPMILSQPSFSDQGHMPKDITNAVMGSNTPSNLGKGWKRLDKSRQAAPENPITSLAKKRTGQNENQVTTYAKKRTSSQRA